MLILGNACALFKATPLYQHIINRLLTIVI